MIVFAGMEPRSKVSGRSSSGERQGEGRAAASVFTGSPSPKLLKELSQFFRLLSEPARLLLLCHLKQGPMDVASLIAATGFSQSHISRQLGQLQRAGLVSCERDGVRLIYQADDQLVQDLCALVQNRLRQRLEAQLAYIQNK